MKAMDAFAVNWPGRIVLGAGKLAVPGEEANQP